MKEARKKKREAIRKQELAAELNLPKRLRAFISQEQLEQIREHVLTPELEPPKRLKSETFDPRKAVSAVKCDGRAAELLLAQLANVCSVDESLDIAESFLRSLKPRNGLESLLCAQMAGTHLLGMAELANAARNDGEVADMHTARAVRLLRLFCLQVETLEMLRNKKGRQTVLVKHVQVVARQAAISVRGGV
jgi:hypothetical protein